mgnify:FL=1|tara:strand:+ start:286 stop:588 length:303 start_codon:yes stop_codon:yes gene_type:complete
MAFKGVLPSDLWDKYDCEDGFDRMQLDLEIAREINEQINEATRDAQKSGAKASDAKGAVARRNQRREARKNNKHLSNSDDFFSAVEKAGVPVREVGVDED